MLSNQNPEELLFFIFRLKEDSKKQKLNIKLEDKTEIIIESKDLKKDSNENFITRIVYFKIIKGKNYLITFGTKTSSLNYNNELQFIYDDILKDNSIIEMFIFEKFKSYKKFVENSDIPKLLNIFYNDSFKLCLKPSIHFLILLDILQHFREQSEKTNKLFRNFSLVYKFNNFNIDELKELNDKHKYIELIEYLTQNQNLSLKSKNEERGKVMVMIFLYVCLSYEDKFIILLTKRKWIKKKYII